MSLHNTKNSVDCLRGRCTTALAAQSVGGKSILQHISQLAPLTALSLVGWTFLPVQKGTLIEMLCLFYFSSRAHLRLRNPS